MINFQYISGQHITFTTTHFEKSLGTALRNQVDVACPNGGLQVMNYLIAAIVKKFKITLSSV